MQDASVAPTTAAQQCDSSYSKSIPASTNDANDRPTRRSRIVLDDVSNRLRNPSNEALIETDNKLSLTCNNGNERSFQHDNAPLEQPIACRTRSKHGDMTVPSSKDNDDDDSSSSSLLVTERKQESDDRAHEHSQLPHIHISITNQLIQSQELMIDSQPITKMNVITEDQKLKVEIQHTTGTSISTTLDQNKLVLGDMMAAYNANNTIHEDEPSRKRSREADASMEPWVVNEDTLIKPPRMGKFKKSPRKTFRYQRGHLMVCRLFDSTKYTPPYVASYDQENQHDLIQVTDYVADIFQRLYLVETKCRPKPYMHKQTNINASMRMILVDWIVEIHQKFRLEQETLHLCVNILDRYLALVEIDRSRLQLVGITALWIASKYEEIYPPLVKDCVYVTDRAYTHQDILDMERQILQSLEFRVSVPTAHPFLRRFLCITKATPTMRTAAAYYLDRILQEHDLLVYRPSLVAAAAVSLSLNHPEIREFDGLVGDIPGVPDVLLSYTGYSRDVIVQAAQVMSKKISQVTVVTESKRELYAVKRKYQSDRYYYVSVEFGTPDSFVHEL